MLGMRCIRISNAAIARRFDPGSGRKWTTQKDKDEDGPLSTGDVPGGSGGAEFFASGGASAPDTTGGEPGNRQAGSRAGRDAAGAQIEGRHTHSRRRGVEGVCPEDVESADGCE